MSLILKDCTSQATNDSLDFSTGSIWVKTNSLPLDMMIAFNAYQISSLFGTFEEIKLFDGVGCLMDYRRVQIELNFYNPLIINMFPTFSKREQPLIIF